MDDGIEDAIATYILKLNKIFPIANLKEKDSELGNLKYITKNNGEFNYILRFATGFGSQRVFFLL